MKPVRIAIIGCGHICQQYGNHVQNYPDALEIAGATDLDLQRAVDFCDKYGGKPYSSFEEVLADPSVDIVVNLTIHHAHFDLNSRALKAGKHVFTEKPMALTYAQSKELCEIAKQHQRLFVAAPTTFLGEGIQTAAKFLESDKLGALRLVYAEVNWAQIERWISNPAPYFTVGPLLDVGVYAITALTYLLGPVKQVWGYSTILKNPRQDKEGKDFPVTAPDFTTGIMEFENGVVCRLTTNYYVPSASLPHLRGLEFHGDEGSFTVSDYHDFHARCLHIPYKQPAIEIPLLREAQNRMDRAVGLADMARAIHENRQPLVQAEHAAHVVEVMEGLQKSSDQSQYIAIESTFAKPGMMEWTKNIKNNAQE